MRILQASTVVRRSGPVIEVFVDKEYAWDIAFAPYQTIIKNVKPGRHKVDLILCGSRVNTFGALHNCNEYFWWHGADDYRVNRDEWSYEYQLKPAGVLKCPEIFDNERYAKV